MYLNEKQHEVLGFRCEWGIFTYELHIILVIILISEPLTQLAVNPNETFVCQ